MTNSLVSRCAPRAESVREAAAAEVVPLLRASLDPASLRPARLMDCPAGRIITQVLYRDADAETFDGTVHLAAGVVLVLSWLVSVLAARTQGCEATDLAGELAAQFRLERGGGDVAEVLDHLVDGTVGAQVLGRLLAEDQEALLDVVLKLAGVAASQALALACSDGIDVEVVWSQIEEGLRDHP